MQVICTDGTVLQCQRFEAIDSGVLLFDEQQRVEASEEDDEDETERDEASAFVPIHQLRFVLPDGVQPGRSGAQSMGQPTPQPASQAPPPGQMPPQQPMGGQSSSQQGGAGQPPSRSGPNRR